MNRINVFCFSGRKAEGYYHKVGIVTSLRATIEVGSLLDVAPPVMGLFLSFTRKLRKDPEKSCRSCLILVFHHCDIPD
jgi:hypothetical protein